MGSIPIAGFMIKYKKSKILLDENGSAKCILKTKNGLQIATGYTRVVIGQRGPYVEFSKNQLVIDNMHIPEDQKYRLNHGATYYNEWRTNEDWVKIYEQKKTVKYADYKVGLWYISPNDLFINDGPIIVLSQDLFK